MLEVLQEACGAPSRSNGGVEASVSLESAVRDQSSEGFKKARAALAACRALIEVEDLRRVEMQDAVTQVQVVTGSLGSVLRQLPPLPCDKRCLVK